jgi:hypothetical protein
MARYAIVRGGILENVCEWDGDTAKWSPPEGALALEVEGRSVGPGWSYDGQDFTPPAPEPVKVTLSELLEQYHTPEQFAAIRRADELAKTLAIGDPQGVLTNETDEELAALEAIGEFFFLQRIKGGLIDLSTTKLFDEAAKLGVYGDSLKAVEEVSRLKEGRVPDVSIASIEAAVEAKP